MSVIVEIGISYGSLLLRAECGIYDRAYNGIRVDKVGLCHEGEEGLASYLLKDVDESVLV